MTERSGMKDDVEQMLQYYKKLVEHKDQDIASLEKTVHAHVCEQQKLNIALQAANNASSAATLACAQKERQLEAEIAARRSEADTAAQHAAKIERALQECQQAKVQLLADAQEMEALLCESEAARKSLHDKYMALGHRMEELVAEDAARRKDTEAQREAAKLAVQEAVRDTEKALEEKHALANRVHALQVALDEEIATRKRLKKQLQRDGEAAKQTAADLGARLANQTTEMCNMRKYIEKCEATVANAHGQIASLKAEVRVAREEAAMHKERAAAVKSAADAEAGERLQLALQQQKLSFQERMQTLELENKRLELENERHKAVAAATSPTRPTGSPGRAGGMYSCRTLEAEYSGVDSMQLLESKLAAQEAELHADFHKRLAQVERECKWRCDAEQQAAAHRVRQAQEEARRSEQHHKGQLEAAQAELRGMQDAHAALQGKLKHAAADAAALQDQLKELQAFRDAHVDGFTELKRTVGRLRGELEHEQQRRSEVNDDLVQEKAKATQLQQRMDLLISERDKATKRVSTLEATIHELQHALDTARAQAQAAAGEAERALIEAHEQRSRADTAVHAAKRDAQAVADRSIREERAKAREAAQHAQHASAREAEAREETVRLEEQHANLQTVLREARSEQQQLRKTVQDLQDALQRAQCEAQRAQQEVHAARATAARELHAIKAQACSLLCTLQSKWVGFKASMQEDITRTAADCTALVNNTALALAHHAAARSPPPTHSSPPPMHTPPTHPPPTPPPDVVHRLASTERALSQLVARLTSSFATAGIAVPPEEQSTAEVVMHDLAAAAGAPLTPRTQALDAQLRHAHALLAAWERAHASMRRTLQEREGTLSEAKARIRQLQKELTQAQDSTVEAVEAAGPLRAQLMGIKEELLTLKEQYAIDVTEVKRQAQQTLERDRADAHAVLQKLEEAKAKAESAKRDAQAAARDTEEKHRAAEERRRAAEERCRQAVRAQEAAEQEAKQLRDKLSNAEAAELRYKAEARQWKALADSTQLLHGGAHRAGGSGAPTTSGAR